MNRVIQNGEHVFGQQRSQTTLNCNSNATRCDISKADTRFLQKTFISCFYPSTDKLRALAVAQLCWQGTCERPKHLRY